MQKVLGKLTWITRFLLASALPLLFLSAAGAEEYQHFYYTFENGNQLAFGLAPQASSNDLIQLWVHSTDEWVKIANHLDLTSIVIDTDHRNSETIRPGVATRTGASRARSTSFRLSGDVGLVTQWGDVARLPVNNWSTLKFNAISIQGTRYLVVSFDGTPEQKGTYVIRKDGKTLKVSDSFVDVTANQPALTHDILTVPGVSRQVHLSEFDSEASASAGRHETPANSEKEMLGAYRELLGASRSAGGVADAGLPVNGWSNVNFASVSDKEAKYLVVSFDGTPAQKGTYVIRQDGKALKISHSFADVKVNPPALANGILTLPTVSRQVDLNQFDGEVRSFQASATPDTVLDKDGKPVDFAKDVLGTYRDLVEEARNSGGVSDKADPEVIQEMAESIRAKRSVVVLGKAGTGKSSAVRAFASEVAAGRVPGIPRTLRILEVPMSSLASGTSLVGVMEQRIASLKAASKQGGIVYFIDETHSMSGQGSHANKATDIVQDLKGDMEKGNLTIIGTDTDHEFRNAFGKDPAFIDRFDQVHTEEPKGDDLIQILRTKFDKDYPEAKPSDELLREAVRLSDDFDVSSAQPRAAVNLLKKAYAIELSKTGKDLPPSMDSLKRAVVKRYRADPARFNRDALKAKLGQLRAGLDERFPSDSEVKKAVVSLWKRKLSGVGDPDQVQSVLLYGPPGTGKTSTAKASAELMGYEYTTIEMNKYAPGGLSLEEFRREIYGELQKNPFRVFVLDEVEKADRRVQEAALSMLQSGEFKVTEHALGGGQVDREIKARHALFMLTSNAGGRTKGELTGDALKEALARGGLSEPILSRVQSIHYLGRPTKEEFRSALKRTLDSSITREQEKLKASFKIDNEDEFLDSMTDHYNSSSDYRDVKKLISNEVEEVIADSVFHENFGESSTVHLHWDRSDETLSYKCIKSALSRVR